MSGAAAGAVMVARNGPKQMLGSAIVGGVLLGGLITINILLFLKVRDFRILCGKIS